jgi:hypothetical protein
MGDTNQLGIDYAKGATFVDAATTVTGRWCAITFFGSAAITEIISTNYDGASLAGHTPTAGVTIYGVFTSINLSAGHCVAYKL